MARRVAVFGAGGAIGRSVGPELAKAGVPFIVVGRNRGRLSETFPDAEVREADLSDPAAAERAARGADVVLYAVGLPYPQFASHPVLMRSAIDGAVRAGVERLIVVSSVYGYGPPRSPKVAETHSREPEAWKGKMRKEQEDVALEAHRQGRIRSLVLRLPDFYGPYAELSLAHLVFDAAVKGKRATWLGSPDLPHEFVYMPDAAQVIVALLQRDDLDGEAWNFGGPGTITGREFMTAAFEAAGHKPRWIAAGRTMLRIGGLFNPLMRELVELFYLSETPVILDDSRLAARLGSLPRTPYLEGIRKTVAFLRR